MDLRQLRYVVAVADERHFTRAAAREHVAQPALSQQIRKLEQELGLTLFHRTTRHVATTEAGDQLVARARRVLAEIAAAETELQQLSELLTGSVTIGVTQTPGPLDVLRLLSSYHASHPGVRLVVREGISEALTEDLFHDELDLAFLTGEAPGQRSTLHAEVLGSEPLAAVLPPGHPMAKRRSIRLASLRDERFVAFPEHATIRTDVQRAARREGFELNIAFETHDALRARAIVSAGLGVAILPESDARRPGPEVATVKLADHALQHSVALCWRADRHHSPAAAALIMLVRGQGGSAGRRSS